MGEATTALAERGGTEIVQTLDSGVYDLLDQMFDAVGDQLMPLTDGGSRGRRSSWTAE